MSIFGSSRCRGNTLNNSELVAISLGFGLSISVIVYGFGHVSGGHINPAVTFAFLLIRSIDVVTGLCYMGAQFAGAFLGALLLWWCSASVVSYCDGGRELGKYTFVREALSWRIIDQSLFTLDIFANEQLLNHHNISCPPLQNVCDVSHTPDGSYSPTFGLGANALGTKVTNGCGFIIETIGTYLLVLKVLNSAVHPKSTAGNAAPITIGWAVLIAHLGAL